MSKHQTPPPDQKAEQENETYLGVSLKLVPFLEVLLAGAGLYYLGFAEGGAIGWAKLIIFCVAAYAVSYAIYRMAIEKGVPLVAAGSKLAAPLSGLTVALVGTAFFLVTGPGLTISKVEELRQAEYLEALGSYSNGRIAVADQAAELVPIMQAMAVDLQVRTELESETGRGPIARTLDALFGRADGLSTQMTVSLGVRQEVMDRIANLRNVMETTLADEQVSIWDRRASLRVQHGQMLSLLAELDKAVPVSVVRSYASELQSGGLIPNREDASARINRTLSGYSGALMAALSEQKGVAGDPPAFPSKTGALDTFQYAGKFAPIFLLTFIVDLAFPLALWAYTLMTVLVHMPRTPAKPRQRSDFDDLTDLRAIDMRRLRDDDDDASDKLRDSKPKR
ncbi:MAG: hypothetical protein L3J16_02710 [Anaerolineales bacterium]|nr:hypothetical protein [Anaerolineales bacterium]